MDLVGSGMRRLLAWNEAQIDAVVPKGHGPLDTADFPWTSEVSASWAEVRAELDAIDAQGLRMPETSDVAGFDQGNEGSWTTFVLYSYGTWISQNVERCPRTAALARRVPGLHVAGFSVLGPHAHLPRHRGFNRGALRYQLGMKMAGPAGTSRLQVGDVVHPWSERASVVFDHSVEHEAWNDSDEPRTVLFLEFRWPLPGRVGLQNRATQALFGLAARGLPERVKELEDVLNG